MKTLAMTLALAALVAAPTFVQSANAAPMTNERERAIQECMEMNKKNNTDPYGSTGSVQHMYRACMINKGQMP